MTRLKKTFSTDKPSGYPSNFPTLLVEPSPATLTTPEAYQQLKNQLNVAARRLSGVDARIPREKLVTGAGHGMKNAAGFIVREKITRSTVKRALNELVTAGKLPSEFTPDRLEFVIEVLEGAVYDFKPGYFSTYREAAQA